MAASTKIWINNSPPQCAAEDLNGFELENNNLIESVGLVLNTSDHDQTTKAVAAYAANGDFYTDSGAANAYILTPQDDYLAPPTYFMGMRVRFVVGTTNTGASTVNVASLGVVTIVDRDGSALDAGDLLVNRIVELTYNDTGVSPVFMLTDNGGSAQGFHTGFAVVDTGSVLPDAGQWITAGSVVSRTTYLNLYSRTIYNLVGSTTNSSAIVTGLSSTTKLYVGEPVEGTGIPANTTVQSIDSSTQITLSNNATQTASTTLHFFPYGNGDGSTTFGTWNPAGRSPIGAGQGSGLTNRAPGETGGSEDTIQETGQVGIHNHGQEFLTKNVGSGTDIQGGSSWTNFQGTSNNNTPAGQPMPTMNPWIGTNWIIKT